MNRKLRAKIIEHYGSQSNFAEFMDLRESHVSRVIRGRDKLSYAQQKEWAHVLQSTTQYLFGK